MDNGFTYRYAIRRPDGELMVRPSNPLESLFGTPSPPVVYTWDSREEAEAALAATRSNAAQLGIGEWAGAVVQSLCTPFTLHDPAEEFADEVSEWLSGQGR